MATSKLLLSLFLLSYIALTSSSLLTNTIQTGFSATPDSSSSQFQPLLTDPTTTFSFGFLRVNSLNLDLAVVHLPSSLPLWRAAAANPATWSTSTTLSFNGTLILSNSKSVVIWSTNNINGDQLTISNTSNLQIHKLGQLTWQSFDFPSDTIIQGQNFTSNATLLSSNSLFSMKLGTNYLALYMQPSVMYWKHTALEAKAQIVAGKGPIYARIEKVGYLGLYQTEQAPIDVTSFNSFSRGIQSLRRLTIETDGNLKAYYWNGTAWILDFVSVTEACGLPMACGPYGVCHVDGSKCECLDNRTEGCFPADSGNLCGVESSEYRILRRKGVNLAYKELLGFRKVRSLEDCEGFCERNCNCWGAIYGNNSGYCYQLDYPIETVMGVDDENQVGYFKVRLRESEGQKRSGRRKAGVALVVVGVVVLAGGCGFAGYRVWNMRKRRGGGVDQEGMGYKDLGSSSFGSVELCNSFRKEGDK